MAGERDGERRWRVGELARASGITVRTLHHYDALGLVRPSARSEAGHRLYGAADVLRLYRVVALRQMGFPLREIGAVLDRDGVEVLATVHRQMAEVQGRIEAAQELHRRLARICDALERSREPSVDDLLQGVEGMSRTERYFTPEQLAYLDDRRRHLGRDGIAEAEAEWPVLIAAMEAERRAGTDPADPRVAPLARRWHQLIQAFTGGDPGVRASLQRMYQEEDVGQASRGTMARETMEYAGRAMRAAGLT